MTHVTVWTDELDRRLIRLLSGGDAGLDGGAELEVRNREGHVALLAPLARHHRIAGPNLVWIRPAIGGYAPERDQPGEPAYAFDLGTARRRALEFTTARLEGEQIHLELISGQTAVIRPAAGDMLAELNRWDTYYYTVLDADAQAELDDLAHDA